VDVHFLLCFSSVSVFLACAVHAVESGFRDVDFGHDHGIHLAAGPDLMHLLLEGLAMTLVFCIATYLASCGVLSDINATLANMHIRSNDPTMKFTWVRTGLQSLSYVCAEDVPGVLNALILAFGIYTRGSGQNLQMKGLLDLHRALYLFSAMYRNMKMRDHTEQVRCLWCVVASRCVLLFFCCVLLLYAAFCCRSWTTWGC
jgi:hypothetical protein